MTLLGVPVVKSNDIKVIVPDCIRSKVSGLVCMTTVFSLVPLKPISTLEYLVTDWYIMPVPLVVTMYAVLKPWFQMAPSTLKFVLLLIVSAFKGASSRLSCKLFRV